MSATVRRNSEQSAAVGRVEVTERTVRELQSFARDASESVHIERRGTRTYVVAE